MKFFGQDLKFNGFDIWHKGNFNPDDKADVQKTSKKTLNAGWYRIAQNSGNRAFGRFIIKEERSGSHQTVEFLAGIHYSQSPILNILANSSYSGNGTFRYIRIVRKSTYDPVYLEVYIDLDSTTGIQAFLFDNIQTSGWQLLDWEPGSIPTGYSEYRIDLDLAKGFNTTEEINASKGFKWDGQSLDSRYAKPSDIPTKLSQLENDIGAGGGVKITTSPTAPSNPSPGDFWYKEV